MFRTDFEVSFDVMTKETTTIEKRKKKFDKNKINVKNLLNRFFNKDAQKQDFKVNIDRKKKRKKNYKLIRKNIIKIQSNR